MSPPGNCLKTVTYTVELDDDTDDADEQATPIPPSLVKRKIGTTYVWCLFFVHDHPMAADFGSTGDVLIDTRTGLEDVYIKNEMAYPSWNVWHKNTDYGHKKNSDSEEKFRHSYHPWLRKRCLQFDGNTLLWSHRREYIHNRRTWNEDPFVKSGSRPRYDLINSAWIARLIIARHHLPPLLIWPTSSSPVPASNTTDTANPAPIPTKRCRSPSLDSSGEDSIKPTKRVREEETGVGTSATLGSGHVSPEQPPSVPRPDPSATLVDFLAGLPLSLVHHVELFVSLGINDMRYIKLLATLSKPLLNDVLAELQRRGLTFMESLVLRQAFTALRPPPASQPTDLEPSSDTPETIEDFLIQVGGTAMARHAPVFHELGVDVAHIPVLAQLDTGSYAEFETMLDKKGLAWVERFIIKAAISRYVGDRREVPLLAA